MRLMFFWKCIYEGAIWKMSFLSEQFKNMFERAILKMFLKISKIFFEGGLKNEKKLKSKMKENF